MKNNTTRVLVLCLFVCLFCIGAVSASRTVDSATLNDENNITAVAETSITATATVTLTNGDDWEGTGYRIGDGNWKCSNTPDHSVAGTYTGSFTINAPSDAGVYNVEFRASGKDNCDEPYGSTYTLTDGITVVNKNIQSATLNGAGSVSVPAGTSITAALTVQTGGSGEDNDWESTSYKIGDSGSFTCVDTGDHTGDGTNTESFVVSAPASASDYNVYFIAHSGDGCSSSVQSNVYTLTNGITVIPVCGDGITEGTEQCDGGGCCNVDCTFKSNSNICRASAGVCDVAEVCDGISNDCPEDAKALVGTPCPDGLYCNGDETCDANGNCQAGTQVDCSENNILGIGECGYYEGNPFMYYYREAFTSACIDTNWNEGYCTEGSEEITSECNHESCEALCESDNDCEATSCDEMDGCYEGGDGGGIYRTYADVSNSCTECSCTKNVCDENSGYTEESDEDGDGVSLSCGDACPNDAENDIDGDGICGDVDNCANVANQDQANADGDNLGDICDTLTGNSGNVNTNEEGLLVEVGGSTDLDQEFSETKPVKMSDGVGNAIVEFDWNFDSSVLDLSSMTVNTDESAGTGSVQINGLALPAGITKTVYVNKLTTSNAVCIKDVDNALVTEISSGCNGADEVELSCPGTSGAYTCTIESDGRYKITGLTHSAVKEYTITQTTTVSSGNSGGGNEGDGGGSNCEYECKAWGACVNGKQTRTCTPNMYCDERSNNKALTERTCSTGENMPLGSKSVETTLTESEQVNQPAQEIVNQGGNTLIGKVVTKTSGSGAHPVLVGLLIAAIIGDLGIFVYMKFLKP